MSVIKMKITGGEVFYIMLTKKIYCYLKKNVNCGVLNFNANLIT